MLKEILIEGDNDLLNEGEILEEGDRLWDKEIEIDGLNDLDKLIDTEGDKLFDKLPLKLGETDEDGERL